jgi:peptidylprolyl isomerase
MRKAKEGDRVKIHYRGRLEDGTIFDSSEGDPPLDFCIGENKLLPGVEKGVIGMTVDSELTVTIRCADAFGERMDDLIMDIDRSKLPEGLNPEVGQQLQLKQDDENPIMMTVLNVDQDSIRIDGNHPLAGSDLIFDLRLVEIA